MARLTVKASHDFGWLTSRVGLAVTPGFRMVAAHDSAGRIRGAVGFDHWTDNSVQMHFAMDAPIAVRALLQPAFSYAFEEAGKGVAVGVIRDTNAKSLSSALGMGFRELCRIRDGGAVGVDLVVVEMRKEECRYIGEARRAA